MLDLVDPHETSDSGLSSGRPDPTPDLDAATEGLTRYGCGHVMGQGHGTARIAVNRACPYCRLRTSGAGPACRRTDSTVQPWECGCVTCSVCRQADEVAVCEIQGGYCFRCHTRVEVPQEWIDEAAGGLIAFSVTPEEAQALAEHRATQEGDEV